jgi:hypothetical protein
MGEPTERRDRRSDEKDDLVEDWAEAFNAKEVLDDPDHLHEKAPSSPTSDADAPAP